jgi:hypothetical protein
MITKRLAQLTETLYYIYRGITIFLVTTISIAGNLILLGGMELGTR